ncbi:hypothetical protein BDV95DRAFT_260531 [Massariosphaeria phaeospora]|uniref:Secreted protein n=1 Tax=Massariosphaeria phaeospora TaxID=100035 RepID=A0A7C8M0P4_9PLEO|nr:hypothetical protein BDV95DRAFT_260531 [Massariosphaeria phaeospora]
MVGSFWRGSIFRVLFARCVSSYRVFGVGSGFGDGESVHCMSEQWSRGLYDLCSIYTTRRHTPPSPTLARLGWSGTVMGWACGRKVLGRYWV